MTSIKSFIHFIFCVSFYIYFTPCLLNTYAITQLLKAKQIDIQDKYNKINIRVYIFVYVLNLGLSKFVGQNIKFIIYF